MSLREPRGALRLLDLPPELWALIAEQLHTDEEDYDCVVLDK